ncbi:hypothetical protein Tco_0193883 [Tanacetum coccineum]
MIYQGLLLFSLYGKCYMFMMDLIESMQNFLKEAATQPEYLQALLQSLLEDLQILNEIQPLKQEILNQVQKDQEEKSIVELLAEERFQKDNQVLNESQSSQEMKIQDLEFQIATMFRRKKLIRMDDELGIREYRIRGDPELIHRRNKQKNLGESEARVQSRKIIIDDDDDDLGFYAVHSNTIHIPFSQNVEPKDSFIMGDGHINITPETETNNVDSFYEKSTSRLAHIAPIPLGIVEVCVNDNDSDYDDDFYDCVDFEEDGGEIDLDISKIDDIPLREKLVGSYLLIEKINAFSLSPPIPISPTICPSSIIPIVDIDLPVLEEEGFALFFPDISITRLGSRLRDRVIKARTLHPIVIIYPLMIRCSFRALRLETFHL